MYRQQYKETLYTGSYVEAKRCQQRDNDDANPKNKLNSHRRSRDPQHSSQYKEAAIDNYSNTQANGNSDNNNLERESRRGESINRKEIRASSCDPYFNFKALHKERNVEESVNTTPSLENSRKSLDPLISIQGDVSVPRRDSLPFQPYQHRPSLKKRRRSVDHNQTTIGEQAPPKDTAIEQRLREYSDCEGGSNDINGNYKGHDNLSRRASSLNSIPSYFYPDPYSIVFSRYLEELGSLSPLYSSAAGSEGTEYLQLSRTVSPLSTPGKVDESTSFIREEERRRKESGSSFLACGGEKFDDKMNFDSALSTSEEYQSFRSSVPLRKICVESDGSKEWKVYDAGPRTVRTPLLCIGPASSTADVFYRQILNLTARGIRVISVEGPVYWSVDDWCKGLKKLLDCLNLDKVHIFGASLGGFLAQKFAEYTYHYSRVASLVLCNTFLDTSIFDYHDSAMIFWMLPSVILKKLIIENITAARIMDLDIAHAIEFMIERLNNLSQQELASRMTLNCVNCHVDTFKLKQIKMTIVDVFDESALSGQAREDIYRNYTDAKLAHLKSGGNFPYLSRSDEVNMHIMVHLRAFNNTKHSAQLEEIPSPSKAENGPSTSRPISTRQSNGSTTSSKNPEDVFGSTQPNSFTPSSVEDRNQAYKEEAASALDLPVQ